MPLIQQQKKVAPSPKPYYMQRCCVVFIPVINILSHKSIKSVSGKISPDLLTDFAKKEQANRKQWESLQIYQHAGIFLYLMGVGEEEDDTSIKASIWHHEQEL